ncbi:unnamed protein product [Vitrella brassicaformis CCMP3155]|uniref:RING-type domain-containing protein n=1 Tax=Vitrella brassicaformis (strain CCMP3155) TaxID=1169540 RepID=A0A0G4ELX9_VITBC|nr:unnamed protein product [Vitrella brassicaformis CCMP3155]|eukprot:CEL97838.1 unnamed protein product [Vitrella brassicaformis CCMP3155]
MLGRSPSPSAPYVHGRRGLAWRRKWARVRPPAPHVRQCIIGDEFFEYLVIGECGRCGLLEKESLVPIVLRSAGGKALSGSCALHPVPGRCNEFHRPTEERPNRPVGFHSVQARVKTPGRVTLSLKATCYACETTRNESFATLETANVNQWFAVVGVPCCGDPQVKVVELCCTFEAKDVIDSAPERLKCGVCLGDEHGDIACARCGMHYHTECLANWLSHCPSLTTPKCLYCTEPIKDAGFLDMLKRVETVNAHFLFTQSSSRTNIKRLFDALPGRVRALITMPHQFDDKRPVDPNRMRLPIEFPNNAAAQAALDFFARQGGTRRWGVRCLKLAENQLRSERKFQKEAIKGNLIEYIRVAG